MEKDGRKIGFFGGKMLPVHCGHVYSILKASSLCDELHVLLFYNTPNEDLLIKESVFPHELLKKEIRELILKYELLNYKNIKIHAIDHKKIFNTTEENVWDSDTSKLIQEVGCIPNIIFSSEPEMNDNFKLSFPNACNVFIDPDRSVFNISSTKIREGGPFKNWEYIPKSLQTLCSRSVVVFGEEEICEFIVKSLCTLLKTCYIESSDCLEENEAKKNILNARFNANKVFFIKSCESDIFKNFSFYKQQDLRITINYDDIVSNDINAINLIGTSSEILTKALKKIFEFIN